MGGNHFKGFKEFLTEGGNIFGSTGPIKKEWIDPTLKQYYKELGRLFPKKKSVFKSFTPVGSVGKKPMSGDIDLAIDISKIVDKTLSKESIENWNLNYDDVLAQFAKLKKRSRSATDSQLMTKATLQGIAAYIDKKSKILEVDLKKITPSNMFGAFPQYDEKSKKQKISVQLDWMVGNLDWLTFSYYSQEYKGAVKGLHRTQLVLALFSALGYTFNHGTGVKHKESGLVVAETPKDAMDILSDQIGKKIDTKIINNYFTLHKWMEKNLKKNTYNDVIDIYLKILDSTRADIPEDLQQEWLNRQSKLKLTGKFLPADSSLLKNIK